LIGSLKTMKGGHSRLCWLSVDVLGSSLNPLQGGSRLEVVPRTVIEEAHLNKTENDLRES